MFIRSIAATASVFAALSASAQDQVSSTHDESRPALSRTTLEQLAAPAPQEAPGLSDLRAQMLRDAGKTVGFRGGMAARSESLARALGTRADALAAMFPFAALVSKSGTVPPVIVSAKDVASFSADQARSALQVYKIEREERFVSTPPTWRDYLMTGLSDRGNGEAPTLQVRPLDERERSLWKAAVADGWSEGVEQADAILKANFNRLVRDHTGMVTYSVLLQHGMITATRVAETQQTVTGDQRQIVIGDTLRRVTSKAGFQTDPKKWRPTLTSSVKPGSDVVAPAARAASSADAR